MIWIDIVCLVCILLFTLVGVWRGFLRSVFRLGAWACAIVGAYISQDFLSGFIARNLDISGFTVKLVCICVGFLVPFLAISLIGIFANKAISGTAVSKVNRAFGGVFGAIKAYAICFVLLTILHIIPVSGSLKEARNNSTSYSIYKANIELLGFSSEEVDLIGVAEKKASELSKELTDKAMEKAKEGATQAAEEIKNKAEEEAKKIIDEGAKKAIEDAKAAAQEKTKKHRKKKRVADTEGDEIEYNSEKDIPIDE